MVESRGAAYGRLIGAALIVSAVLTGVVERPAEAVITAVRGEACAYSINVGLFGGQQERRGCGQTVPPGNAESASPSVALPAGGSATPIIATDPNGAEGKYGPASIFSGRWPEDVAEAPPSGPMRVSAEGTPGGGSVSASADIVLHDAPIPVRCFGDPTGTTNCEAPGGFGPGPPFEGDEVHASCTATEDGVVGSTSFVNGLLSTSTDSGGSPTAQEPIPDNPPINYTRSGVIDNVGDVYAIVFNEQVVNPDGSLTVNALHMYLFGPVAVGEAVVGQVTCGTTPSPVSPEDTVAPTCGVPVVVLADPVEGSVQPPVVPRQEIVGVADAGGIQSVTNRQVENGTIYLGTVPFPGSAPPPYLNFTPGQKGPLPVIAVRTDAAEATNATMTWSFDVTDVAGNTTRCRGTAPSRVDDLLPSAGPPGGGNEVIIIGTGFQNATGVAFGGVAAPDFDIDRDTQITAVVPAGTPGTVPVTVTTPTGTLSTTAGDGYTYLGAPTTTTSTPVSTTTTTTTPGPTTTTTPGATTTTAPDGTTTTTSPGSTTTTSTPTSTTTTSTPTTTSTTIVNQAPTAFNDLYRYSGGDPLVVGPRGVLSNDDDPDGDEDDLKASLTSNTEKGSVTMNSTGDGGFTYTPDPAGFDGSERFIYTATDEDGDTDTAFVTIGEDLSKALFLEVNAAPESRAPPGGSFTFNVLVTNPGDEPVEITKLSDTVYQDLTSRGSCELEQVVTADPNANTYSCSYTGEFRGEDGATQTSEVTVEAAVVGRADQTRTATDSAVVRIAGGAVSSEDDDSSSSSDDDSDSDSRSTRAQSRRLSKTGSSINSLTEAAAVLICLGGTLVLSTRRRRRTSGTT